MNITQTDAKEINVKLKKNLFYYINIFLISYPMFYPAKAIFGHLGQYLLFSIWLLLVILKKPNFIAVMLKESFLFIMFILFLSIKFISANNDIEMGFFSPLRQISQYMVLYVYFIFGLWHLNYSSTDMKASLIKAFFNSFILSTFLSLYYLSINEYAIRRSFDNSYFAVGDYNLVYTSALIVALCWILFKNKKSKLKAFLLGLISLVLVLRANYMTAIIMLFVVGIFSVILSTSKTSKDILLRTILFILVSTVLFYYIENILIGLINIDSLSNVIKVRLNDIYEAIRHGEINFNNSLGSRLSLTLISWETFLKNPIIGINFGNYNNLTIGSHTQWIDNLARYGLYGNALLIIQYLIWIKKWFVKSSNMIDKLALVLSWVFFILLGFLTNNMMVGLFICIFIISNNLSKIY